MKYIIQRTLALCLGLVSVISGFGQCPIANNCTPGNATNAQASLFGGGIFQVKIGAGFANNTPGAVEGYKDFCSLGITEVSLGSPFEISVKTGNLISENLRVFIDVNNDQVFSPTTELFFSSNNAKLHTGSISIPSGTTGVPIKLRITSDAISAAIPTPCSTPEYSQVEDYAIRLQQNVSPPIARFNVSDTLTCSGSVTFTDQSINNPTSWSWSFGDGQVSSLQNPVHQYSGSGIYSVKLKVWNANGVDSITKQNLIRYNDTVPVAASCQPITVNHCCGYGISRFSLGTLDHSSTVGSYQDFSCTKRVKVLQGRSYPVEIGTNPNQNQDTRIWIDYNGNGSFENSELAFSAFNAKNPSGELLISNDTSIKKNKPLRLRVVSEFSGGVVQPCTDLDKGQCEDYTIYIQENTLPPSANFIVTSQNFCQPVFNFTSTSLNVIAYYHWFFGDGKDTVTLTPSVSHSYDNGIYDVKLVTVGPFGSDSITKVKAVAFYGAPLASCTLNTQAGGPQFGTGIAEVSFGTIFNRTENSVEGYKDFSCLQQTTLLIGQQLPVIVRNSGLQVEKVKIWIDWNRNGSLENSELVLNSEGDTVHQGFIVVPSTAVTNSTLRMRVASNFQNAGQFNSCGNIQLGQAEDYGVVVIANTSKPTTYFSADKTISCTGIVQFRDSTQNLPTSYLWDFGDGQTSEEPSPTHTYASIGTYTVKLVTKNDFGIDSLIKPNYIQVTKVTGMVNAICTPFSFQTCCQYGIERVVFAGINQLSGEASEGNRDFTCSATGTAPIGTAQPITIVNSGVNSENVGVWIDWNNDGDFSTSESVFQSTGSTTHSGTINIPGNAPAGVGLRMRVVSDFANQPLDGPCSFLQFGQAEDYQIVLTGNNLPPICLFTANQLVTCSGVVSFSDTSFNAPTSWKWYFGDGDSSTLRNPVHIYTTPGVYTVRLIVTNANGTANLEKQNYITFVDNNGLKPASCTPETINLVNNQGVGISNVVFNTINRASPTAPGESYVDASCANRTTVLAGASYQISVQTNSNFPESCRAWIDWNNSGTFEDPSERILNGSNAQSHTANVTVPATAVTNVALRLRVISDFGGGGPGANIQPCTNPNFGQCEDYAVMVMPNTTPPVAAFSALSTTSCNGAIQFRDNSTFLPTSWLWSFGDGNSSAQQNPTHIYQTTGVYTVKLKVFNSIGSDSLVRTNFVTVNRLDGPRPASCTNTVTSPGITNGTTRVQFGTLDKTSGLAGEDGGYLDYACADSGVVVVSAVNQLNPMVINTSSAGTRENCRVYIDYNNNGVFAANELVINSNANNIHSRNVVLNQTQCLGVPVRMRVITENRFNQITSACYNPQQGQVEDYSVRLLWVVSNNDVVEHSSPEIYPNPSTGLVRIGTKGVRGDRYQIIGMTGNVVAKGELSEDSDSQELNLSGLSNGIYQIQWNSGQKTFHKKLVIQK